MLIVNKKLSLIFCRLQREPYVVNRISYSLLLNIYDILCSIFYGIRKTVYYIRNYAEVVKLANTLRSGRSERKLVRVQLPSSADERVSARGGPAAGGQLPSSANRNASSVDSRPLIVFCSLFYGI